MSSNRDFDPIDLSRDLHTSLARMRLQRAATRSESSRLYAVAITDLEKVVAYFDTYILRWGSNIDYLSNKRD